MARTRAETLRWMQQGTRLVVGALAGLDEEAFGASTRLPGWNRRHVLAHLAANAEAISNLVHWAATGERTPMYSSSDQRDTDIKAGGGKSGAELTDWFVRSSARLESAMDDLAGPQWVTEVVTAQGRTVPASETPWMRAREVMVHAVDLGTGLGFDDLPADFLAALCDDIAGKRSAAAGTPAAGPALSLEASGTGRRWVVAGTGDPALIVGTLPALASYLSGRGAERVVATDRNRVPGLPAWL